MKSNVQSRLGFTMVEVLIASVIAFITLGMIGLGVNRMSKDFFIVSNDFKTETALYQLVELFLKTGQYSDNCVKMEVTSATATISDPISIALKCDIKVYADQPAQSFRFRKIQTENLVRFEAMESGNWITKQTFGGDNFFDISALDICNDVDTIAGSPSCTLNNTSLGRGLTSSGFRSRYFRFRIRATQKDGNNQEKRNYDLQSALYVRNPPPVADVSFLWGAK